MNNLSNRELFCLTLAVPRSGNLELDEIIKEGNRIKDTAMAMQAILSNPVWVARAASFDGEIQLKPILEVAALVAKELQNKTGDEQ